MAYKALAVALTMTVAVSPLSATPMVPAPAGGPDAKYCMRVEAATGSRLETVQCWTRAEWAAEGVDVDHDWVKEGVGVIA